MPLVVDQDYYLELNSVPLACPAWAVLDVWALFDDQALRGNDRILPGATGRRATPRVLDSTVYTLGFEVYGYRDVDGTIAPDPAIMLIQHLDYLRANLGLGLSTGDGTVPAIFHRHTEDALIADVHFLGFRGSNLSPPAYWRTTFDISVPYGWEVSP